MRRTVVLEKGKGKGSIGEFSLEALESYLFLVGGEYTTYDGDTATGTVAVFKEGEVLTGKQIVSRMNTHPDLDRNALEGNTGQDGTIVIPLSKLVALEMFLVEGTMSPKGNPINFSFRLNKQDAFGYHSILTQALRLAMLFPAENIPLLLISEKELGASAIGGLLSARLEGRC